MGKYDEANNVVPAFVFNPPDATKEYDITPVVTYYIATGDYEAGQVVDITSYGPAQAIDFTSAPPGFTVATIIHNPDGTYTLPVFSKPNGQPKLGKSAHKCDMASS